MTAALAMNDEEQARRRRVRNSAILWSLVAAGFYLAFVVMTLVRAHK
jgi:hypothetical protein